MIKIQLSASELESQLNEQVELLKQYVVLYDTGKEFFAKPMATALRVLLHDSKNSRSLLGQMNIKSVKFYDTAEQRLKLDNNSKQYAGSFSALVGISGGGYIPYLDDMPGRAARMVNFEDYWNEVIFIDHTENHFTRGELIHYVASQDGGAHVDPGLDEKYAELSRKNSLGWKSSTGSEWKDIKGAELASIRQITHEILKTLAKDYETLLISPKGPITIGGGGFILTTTAQKEDTPRRKGPCPCGSGKKYKRCCGK